jgi:hypothetical protein
MILGFGTGAAQVAALIHRSSCGPLTGLILDLHILPSLHRRSMTNFAGFRDKSEHKIWTAPKINVIRREDMPA